MTGRMLGFGTILQATTAGGTTASTNAISFLKDSAPPLMVQRETVDVTPLSSTSYREFFAGLASPERSSFDVMYTTTSRGPVWFQSNMFERNPLDFKVILPIATVFYKFSAFITKLGMVVPRDDVILQQVEVQPTGAPTWPTSSM